jgi:polar amino acid transport system substrate-binding protein
MTTNRPSRRSLRQRYLAAAAIAATTAVALAACSSSTSRASSASPSSRTAAIPIQNVVSGIREDPKLHAELPADVRSSGKLVLGAVITPGTSALPEVGQVNGQNVGLDVDLRNAVAKLLGVTWDVRNGSFTTIIPGVQNGEYEVGQAGFAATKARERVIDIIPYLNNGEAFLGGSSVSASAISTITDACGYTIATYPGSSEQTLLTENASRCAAAGKKPWTAQYYNDSGAIFLGLTNGKVDLYFGPTLQLKYDAAHIAGTKFLGQIATSPVGFVTAKGSPIASALRDAINELIANGDYAKIFRKWGLEDMDEMTRSTINPPTNF